RACVLMARMAIKSNPDSGTPAPRRFRWKLFGIGMAAIIAGYVLLGINDITIAPVLLVLGYCVLVPLPFLLSPAGRSGSGRIAQLVERLLYTQKVTGSSPVSPTIPLKTHTPVCYNVFHSLYISVLAGR